jgi:hypothetical protein
VRKGGPRVPGVGCAGGGAAAPLRTDAYAPVDPIAVATLTPIALPRVWGGVVAGGGGWESVTQRVAPPPVCEGQPSRGGFGSPRPPRMPLRLPTHLRPPACPSPPTPRSVAGGGGDCRDGGGVRGARVRQPSPRSRPHLGARPSAQTVRLAAILAHTVAVLHSRHPSRSTMRAFPPRTSRFGRVLPLRVVLTPPPRAGTGTGSARRPRGAPRPPCGPTRPQGGRGCSPWRRFWVWSSCWPSRRHPIPTA